MLKGGTKLGGTEFEYVLDHVGIAVRSIDDALPFILMY